MVKNVPKSKNSIYFIKFYVLHLIQLDFTSFLSQTVQKNCARRRSQDGGVWRQDGENVLAGEHRFYLLEMLLMKFCSVRN